VWVFFLSAPTAFPTGVVSVTPGSSVRTLADDLEQKNVIRSPLAFEILVRLSGHSHDIQAADYLFKAPASVFTIAYRISIGDTGIVPLKVTFPEGTASFDMARILANTISGFDASQFKTLAAAREGYLFPDTYLLLPTATPESVIEKMSANFGDKIASIRLAISSSQHSESDIVTMASIVEREANNPEDRRIVAGILWHRIAIHMPLQVDAVFGYLHQMGSYAPNVVDLESDSPYNTYRHKGLPPGPIANPGIDAIEAAAKPTPSDYLYYLTGKDGLMHYAKTFDEHKANVVKYL
jgi:UPF0755 protein